MLTAKTKTTRHERFLGRVEQLIPLVKLLAVIQPFYPKSQHGRPALLGAESPIRFTILSQHWPTT